MRTFLLLLLSCVSVQAQFGFRNFYDDEARDWAMRRVVTNSSSVSAQAYSTATRWMLWTKSHAHRQKIARANIYRGFDTNALRMPLIYYPISSNAASYVASDLLAGSWVATNYVEATGAKCNGSSQYINTGIGSASVGSANDIHLAVYSRTSVYEVGGAVGSTTSLGYVNYFLFGWVDNNAYLYFDSAGAQVGGADATPPTGFYLATRTSSTSRVIYKNGAVLLSDTSAASGTAINTVAIYVHGLNADNALNSPTTRQLCFYSFGLGIPSTLQGRFYYGVQRMQYEIGRQIVP